MTLLDLQVQIFTVHRNPLVGWVGDTSSPFVPELHTAAVLLVQPYQLEQSSYLSHWSKQFACIPSSTKDTSIHCCFRKQWLTVT